MTSQPVHDVGCLYDLKAPTRDGVRLSADVYLPRDGRRCPAILLHTPYESTRDAHIDWAVGWARLCLRDRRITATSSSPRASSTPTATTAPMASSGAR